MAEWIDRTVLEAASWRLASELVRRHPLTTRVLHTRPGGGQYDCLTITSPDGHGGTVQLNRNGTIQVHHRFNGDADPEWEPTEWDEYLRADPRAFLDRLEQACGLPAPTHVPSSVPMTLTYRVLAALASTAMKSVHPIEIQPGQIDTSGGECHANSSLDSFPAIPEDLRRARDDDPFDQAGYRFWIVLRDRVPILAFEQERGIAWTPHHSEGVELMGLYEASRHNVLAVSVELLRLADNVAPEATSHPMAKGATMQERTMNKTALLAWAEQHAEGPVNVKPDFQLSISSKLVRFRWHGAMTVAVGADADGKTRINATLDALAMFLASASPADTTVHLMLGTGTQGATDPAIKEHLDAIGTLVNELHDGPTIRIWTLAPGTDPVEITVSPPRFTTTTPAKWFKMLMTAATKPVVGMAADVAAALSGRASFALYPKLSSLQSAMPWQMRLDGLEIGRTGPAGTTLRLASKDLTRPNEPRTSWMTLVGPDPIHYRPEALDDLVALVDQLIAAWTVKQNSQAVLGHGQAEHALEAHILSGRLTLDTLAGPLRLAVPIRSGTLAAAQFPTLWGDVTRPARYLDALLADNHRRPWAVELKDQDAGGGHGAYLRHGIGQAVLYRHYIRSAAELDPWFNHHGLNRTECQAALAFPKATASTRSVIERLRSLAALYNVEIIEFPRPT